MLSGLSAPRLLLFSTHLIICDYKNNITNENVILPVIIKLFKLYTEVILEMNPIYQDLFPLILSVWWNKFKLRLDLRSQLWQLRSDLNSYITARIHVSGLIINNQDLCDTFKRSGNILIVQIGTESKSQFKVTTEVCAKMQSWTHCFLHQHLQDHSEQCPWPSLHHTSCGSWFLFRKT